MTTADIITDVIRREGGSTVTNDPKDRGGRTQYGISEKSHPRAWADGKVTEEEARAIYETKYFKGPGFDRVPDERLQALLVDWAVHSGPQLVVMALQKVLKTAQDGILGPQTLEAMAKYHPFEIRILMVAERIKMIGRIVQKNQSQLKFINGWLNRALEFLF